jgi:hypothetical protein
MPNIGERIIAFYNDLKPPLKLGKDIEILHPQKDKYVREVVGQFFTKYYNDDRPRRLLFGINPGRFGAGTTGVNFTAPRQLLNNCGIEHRFKDQSELSAEFIYEMIEAYGGCEQFYGEFFIGSISPLGFVKDGKNINYYDDKRLIEAVKPFIIACMEQQLSWNVDTKSCYCIGGDKNLKFFTSLNDRYKWFRKITPLPHPRFIMQYRRKQKDNFIRQYLSALSDDN